MVEAPGVGEAELLRAKPPVVLRRIDLREKRHSDAGHDSASSELRPFGLGRAGS
jgi:hypothetical protein